MKLTLCIDRQSRTTPSDDLREYEIEIGNPLRSYEDVFDELKIITDDNKKLVGTIVRRCEVNKYGVLKKLDNEEIQELVLPEIILFEGDNYVYIKEYNDLNMKIQYLTNAEMNKYFATKMEMNSTIQQTLDSILLEVRQKIDNKDIIASINTAIKDGQGIIEILGNYLIVNTDNFKLDEVGKLIATAAVLKNVSIDGGNIIINDPSDENDSNLTVKSENRTGKYRADSIILNNPSKNATCSIGNTNNGGYPFLNIYSYGYEFNGLLKNVNSLMFSADNSPFFEIIMHDKSILYVCDSYVEIGPNLNVKDVYANSYNNNSLISKKKNIELFNKGLELINKSDFYMYNYKTEDDDDKKHIGLVIGKNYSTPDEFMNNKKDSIDIYSFVSACGDAIKTLSKKNKILEERIEVLESGEK